MVVVVVVVVVVLREQAAAAAALFWMVCVGFEVVRQVVKAKFKVPSGKQDARQCMSRDFWGRSTVFRSALALVSTKSRKKAHTIHHQHCTCETWNHNKTPQGGGFC